jgi:hypothetical protein
MDQTRPLSRVDETQAVFVETTGRRRRLIAWLAAGICAVGLAFVGLLWFSQAGGSVDAPPAVMCTSGSPAAPVGSEPSVRPRQADAGCVTPTLVDGRDSGSGR